MTKLEKVLKDLEKEGYKVCVTTDIMAHVNFLGTADLLADRENFKVEYNKDGTFTFETTWSNQTITKEWIEKSNRILRILKGEVENENVDKDQINVAKELIQKERNDIKLELRYKRGVRGKLNKQGRMIDDYRSHTIYKMKEVLKIFEED